MLAYIHILFFMFFTGLYIQVARTQTNVGSPTKLTYKSSKTSTHKLPTHLRTEYKYKKDGFRAEKKEHKKLMKQKSSDPQHQHLVSQSHSQLQEKRAHIDQWFEANAVDRTKRFRNTRKFFSKVNRKTSNAARNVFKPIGKAYKLGKDAYELYKEKKEQVQNSAVYNVGKTGYKGGLSLIGKGAKIGSKGLGASAAIVGKGAGGVASARSLGDDIRGMSSNGSGMFASMKQSVSDRFASSSGNLNMPSMSRSSSKSLSNTRENIENETSNKKQKERRNEESDASDEDEDTDDE